jgi:DNA-binding NarL/FixJ family response regulator
MNIRILLADDHKIVRDGLRALLERERDIQVVAEAGDGREIVKMAIKFEPDIVIMDISMPETNGIDAAQQIVSKCSKTKILALSMHSDRHFISEMM